MNLKQTQTSHSVHVEGGRLCDFKKLNFNFFFFFFFLEATGSLVCRRDISRMFIVMNAY